MDLGSVQKAADAVKQQFPDGIDVLCNNAGIMADEDRATKDGDLLLYDSFSSSSSFSPPSPSASASSSSDTFVCRVRHADANEPPLPLPPDQGTSPAAQQGRNQQGRGPRRQPLERGQEFPLLAAPGPVPRQERRQARRQRQQHALWRRALAALPPGALLVLIPIIPCRHRWGELAARLVTPPPRLFIP
jgi:hypothetical protein